jgi:fucose permease
MDQRKFQIGLIYLTGLMQGIALVTFPAAGILLTNPHYHNLSSREYGALFLPMIVGAIIASLVGGKMAAKWGLQIVYLKGLCCNTISLFLFALSSFFLHQHQTDFVILLIALFFLGLGFGGTLTTLNAYIAQFFPTKISTAMTGLHSLLGLGTAIAPLLLNAFINHKVWWGDPLLLALTFVLLFIIGAGILQKGAFSSVKNTSYKVQPTWRSVHWLLWIYISIIFLYGICETVFGNWATIYLHHDKGLSPRDAAWALSLFWAMVTVGRIFVTGISFWISPAKIFLLLPFLILIAFIVIPLAAGSVSNIFVFGFAGVACSACFPLSISFAEHDFSAMTSVVSGRLMAGYMLGYGFAAYGVGWLQESFSISLEYIYRASAIIALVMAIFVMILTKIRRKKDEKNPNSL